jgi:hypothetical protein
MNMNEEFKVGDEVMIESKDGFVFPEPRKIVKFAELDGKRWAFVEGSPGGVEVEWLRRPNGGEEPSIEEHSAAVLAAARTYIGNGWSPIPVEYRGKKPPSGWQKMRITAQEAPHYFNGGPSNIGVLLGLPSNKLLDVDLDCPEALYVANLFLPVTAAVFGREGARSAHRLYVSDLVETAENVAYQFRDPDKDGDDAMLLEVRCGTRDEKGCQTVFPPSIHKGTGQVIRWERQGSPATVKGEKLLKTASLTASAALLMRYWPPTGGGCHKAALVVGGFLARAGFTPDDVEWIVEAIADYAVPDRSEELKRTARDAATAFEKERKTYGLPKLREVFGERMADALAKWLDYNSQHGDEDEEATAEIDEINAADLMRGALPPPRQWLIKGQLCREFVSSITSPGGTGKTTVRLTQAIEVAIGRSLLGSRVYVRTRVLVLSFEDKVDEVHRRLRAICKHHNIDPAEYDGWLFIQRMRKAKIARPGEKGGEPRIGELDGMIRRAVAKRDYGLVILDPFVKIHALGENNNVEMDFVAELLTSLAEELCIAVDVPAHTHKGKISPGDSGARRGASAQVDADRLDFTLTVMDPDAAKTFGIAENDRRQYVRLDSAKVNLTPSIAALWFRLVSVNVGNGNETYPHGDNVQAIEVWTPPSTFAGLDPVLVDDILDDIDKGMADGRRYSDHASATDRAAWRVAQAHCPSRQEGQCREMIRQWVKSKLLLVDDAVNPKTRHKEKGLFVNASKRPERQAEEDEDGED